ncbi:MAG: hypothetical protein LQ346_009053, partial [Caloplaca aetnensis]
KFQANDDQAIDELKYQINEDQANDNRKYQANNDRANDDRKFKGNGLIPYQQLGAQSQAPAYHTAGPPQEHDIRACFSHEPSTTIGRRLWYQSKNKSIYGCEI